MLILYYLLERTLPNDSLVTICPEWTAEKFLAKTGIASMHVAGGWWRWGRRILDCMGRLAECGLMRIRSWGLPPWKPFEIAL